MNTTILYSDPPPPGVDFDPAHITNRFVQACFAFGFCLLISLLFVCSRVYVKWRVTRTFGWADWACLLSYLFQVTIVAMGLFLTAGHRMMGEHYWETRVVDMNHTTFWVLYSSVSIYGLSALSIKLSLFLFYFQLFGLNKVTRWLIFVGASLCILFYISTSIACFALPKVPTYDPSKETFDYWNNISDVVGRRFIIPAAVQTTFGPISDIYLLVIPISSVMRLQMPRKRKVGITAIFLVGLVAVGCSLGNLVLRAKLAAMGDVSYLSLTAFYLSVAEITAGIMCSCMPLLPAMFHHLKLRQRILSTPRSWIRYVRRKGPSSSPASDQTSPPRAQGSKRFQFKSLHLGWTKDVRSTVRDTASDTTTASSSEDGKARMEWLAFDPEKHAGAKFEYDVRVTTVGSREDV